MKRIISLLCLLGMLLCGCTAGNKTAEIQFFAMDTVMSVTIYGKEAEDAARAVQSKINELDKLWSRTNENSDISRINAHAGEDTLVIISPETAELLKHSVEIMEESDGAFNPLLAPVMDAWGFTKEEHRVPEQEELEQLLELLWPMPAVENDEKDDEPRAFLFREGQKLDVGGIAKGLAADIGSRILSEYEIDSALLDLGGNLRTVGKKADGSNWKVGVKDPRNARKALCAFVMNGRTCATSGGYERYFEQDGKIYHHIIDPTTGYPADSDLLSVTVVGEGVLADAYSTAFFVMGSERALEFWREGKGHAASADLILVTADNHVYITEGLEDGFDFLGEESGYTYEFVCR